MDVIEFFRDLYLILFSVGLTYAFGKVLGGATNLRDRISSLEEIFSDFLKSYPKIFGFIIKVLKNLHEMRIRFSNFKGIFTAAKKQIFGLFDEKSRKSEEEINFTFSSSITLMFFLVISVSLIIIFFYVFINGFHEKYDAESMLRIWNILIVSFYGVIITLIPIFIPSACRMLLDGYFPWDGYFRIYNKMKNRDYASKEREIMILNNYLYKKKSYYRGVRCSRFNFKLNVFWIVILVSFLVLMVHFDYLKAIIILAFIVISIGLFLLRKKRFVNNFIKDLDSDKDFYNRKKTEESRANKYWDELGKKIVEIL